MVDNVESDYRIDGWYGGKWREGDANDRKGSEIDSEGQALISAMKARTLSMNLEDGSILSQRHEDAAIGAVCQGLAGGESCVGEGMQRVIAMIPINFNLYNLCTHK